MDCFAQALRGLAKTEGELSLRGREAAPPVNDSDVFRIGASR